MTEEIDQDDLLSGLKLLRTAARILQFAHEIQDARPERPDYLHSVLCQVGLPRSETKSLTFERTNGNASLLIEARKLWNGTVWMQQPLPCGTRPRLALVHVSSEGVRSNSQLSGVVQVRGPAFVARAAMQHPVARQRAASPAPAIASNLQYLCSLHRSTSEVCRSIGINLQQFNKYLSGSTTPSMFNLGRIAAFFGLDSDALCRPSAEFRRMVGQSEREQPAQSVPRMQQSLQAALIALARQNSDVLRPYVGLYFRYNYAFDSSGASCGACSGFRRQTGCS